MQTLKSFYRLPNSFEMANLVATVEMSLCLLSSPHKTFYRSHTHIDV
jgi:hypothetical protein